MDSDLTHKCSSSPASEHSECLLCGDMKRQGGACNHSAGGEHTREQNLVITTQAWLVLISQPTEKEIIYSFLP